MIRLLNGPAAEKLGEKKLWLRRAPIYLRVTVEGDEVDALGAIGHLADKPKPSETIYAYRIKGKPSWIHLLVRGKNAKSRGGFWGSGEYELIDPQPDDATLRDNERWREWATEQYELTKGATA